MPQERIRTSLRAPAPLMAKVASAQRVLSKASGRKVSLNDALCALIERGYDAMRNPLPAAPDAPPRRGATPKPSGLPPVPPVPGQSTMFLEGPK